MRDRVYIVPTWLGLFYFTLAILFFVWGAFGLHPLIGFFGFYLLIFFVFGALQTNENLKDLTLEAAPSGDGWVARVENTGRDSRFAVRVVLRTGRRRYRQQISRLARTAEVALPYLGRGRTRISLTTSFPIGLFHAWKPAKLPPGRFAATLSQANAVPGDVVDHRDFRDGDRDADVDWKRSARRKKRVVKVRERELLPPPIATRRSGRGLFLGLIAQPAALYGISHSPLWLAQPMLLVNVALLWFLFSNYFFPLTETGRLGAMFASLVRVFVISVVAFAALSWVSPDFLAGLLITNSREARSGYTRVAWMDPGQSARLRQSYALVFRARLTAPVHGALYWRGMALTQTDSGLRWSVAADDRMPVVAPGANSVRQEILLEDEDTGAVALDHPVSLPASPVARYYEAFSEITSTTPAPALNRTEFLKLPKSVAPEVKQLADDWRRGDVDLQKFSQRAKEFFHAFRYRLDPGTYERDGLADFLLHRQEGYCEHFAGAFATLLRLGGFPSRVVKGFRDGERNPLDGTYRLRAKDAHAWVEGYSEAQKSWVRFDPTQWAAQRLGEDGAPPRWSRWSARVEQYGQWISDQWEFGWRNHLLRKRTGTWLALTLVIGLLATMLTMEIRRLRRRKPIDPAFAFYDAHCARMASHGLPRQPNEGPLAYAERCAQKFPDLAESIAAVTERYVAERYHA